MNTVKSPFVVLFLWKSLKQKNSDKKKQSTVETDAYPLTAADELTLTHLNSRVVQQQGCTTGVMKPQVVLE